MTLQEKSYLYGLLITDGSLYLQSRDRGRIQLEISEKDKDIAVKLFSLIPKSKLSSRTRTTNFSKEYTSITWSNFQKDFRDELVDFGFPTSNKTNTAAPPIKKYSTKDFWRGVIDGDGSIGFVKGEQAPFISLVTKSEALKTAYCDFLYQLLGIVKVINRNARDGVYNIVVKHENAQQLGNFLYDDCSLSLDRKKTKALEFKTWVRHCKKIHSQYWTDEEIDFILSHSLEASVINLGRTSSSIKNKLFKIRKSK